MSGSKIGSPNRNFIVLSVISLVAMLLPILVLRAIVQTFQVSREISETSLVTSIQLNIVQLNDATEELKDHYR